MTFKTAADVDRERQLSDWQRSTRRSLDAIYSKHPGLARNMANDALIVDMICRFLGVERGEIEITPGDFELAFRANYADFTQSLVWQTPEEQKEQLINEVCELLRSPDGTGKGGKFSDADLKNERARISHWTVDAIIRRKNEIQLAQSLQPKSAAEIREGLSQLRASQEGRKVIPAEITAQLLRNDISLLKHWIRAVGVDVVNDRLFGRA